MTPRRLLDARGPFPLRSVPQPGFWSTLLGSLFLTIAGSGRWSLDARLARAPAGDTAR